MARLSLAQPITHKRNSHSRVIASSPLAKVSLTLHLRRHISLASIPSTARVTIASMAAFPPRALLDLLPRIRATCSRPINPVLRHCNTGNLIQARIVTGVATTARCRRDACKRRGVYRRRDGFKRRGAYRKRDVFKKKSPTRDAWTKLAADGCQNRRNPWLRFFTALISFDFGSCMTLIWSFQLL